MYIYTNNINDLLHPENEPRCLLTRLEFSDDLLCAELSRLAYTDENSEPTRITLHNIGFSQVEWIEKGNSQALLTWNSENSKGVIAFRGTEADDWKDIMSDANLLHINHPNGMGKIHTGFYNAFADLEQEIKDWMEGKEGSWLIAGHSLGAAMATIAATILNISSDKMSLITFGSPRVGNDEFFAAFHEKEISSKRYVNCCDIVCRIPLDIPLINDYKHIEQELYINEVGNIYNKPFDIDNQKNKDQYLILSRGLTDHTPLNYVRALACNDKYKLLS